MRHSKPLCVPLFVPGHRPELLTKAAKSGADAVIMDLEDAVSEVDKPAAYEGLSQIPDLSVPLVVRCNGFGSRWLERDLFELKKNPPKIIMLPKAESFQQIDLINKKFGNLVSIMPIIESALGLANVEDILEHPAVFQIAFGHLDFSFDINAKPDWDALHFARGKMVLASRAAGKAAPLDGVTPDFRDEKIIKRDAQLARDMGFGGKLLIHPMQVAIAINVFRPSEEEYNWAKRVMEAVSNNSSAAQLDGTMIDLPVIRRAKKILVEYKI